MNRKIDRKIEIFIKFVLVIFGLCIFPAMCYFKSNPRQFVIDNTKRPLFYLRGKIDQYHQSEGKYPESLVVLTSYIVDKKGERMRPDRECISNRYEGNKEEHSDLNGEGGWYYNNKTGTIKVNLDKPLKFYFKYYFFPDRNEKPCDW